jgi:hypothetical protein
MTTAFLGQGSKSHVLHNHDTAEKKAENHKNTKPRKLSNNENGSPKARINYPLEYVRYNQLYNILTDSAP